MKTTIRFIDTTGLPEGYDIADLVAEGKHGKEIVDWMKARKTNDPPVLVVRTEKPKKKEQKKKATPAPVVETQPQSNVTPLRKTEPEQEFIPPEFSEDSLADQFTEKYKDDMLYCAAWGTWMVWEENRWQIDDTGKALYRARTVCKKASQEAKERAELGNKRESIANTLASRKAMANVEAMARVDRRTVIRPAEFDADPWVINTPGGIVDLRTGQLRPARKDDYASKQTIIAPEKEPCPVWNRFLDDATDGDRDLKEYLQRVAGYCLTGSIAEHSFFFCYGGGGNGKGTFLNTLDWILNSYSKVANMDTFTETRFARHASELAYFQGARLVTAQETPEGSRWAEARIKSLTGGDPITANWMHQNPFTYKPTFKLLFAGNHKPQLRNVDEAIKRRLYLIPFEVYVQPESRDKFLERKIRAEGGAILQWMIEGCLEWQNGMLRPPARVVASTEDYLESEDRLSRFFDDCCLTGTYERVRSTSLYKRYTSWAEDTGELRLSRKRFLDMLATKGYKSVKKGGEQIVEGIRLVEQEVSWHQ